jgi:uncharacterized Zn-binding protein involved in type VI secretion
MPIEGSAKVFLGGLPAVRVGDNYAPHVPGCTSPPSTHPVVAMMGSTKVFIENQPAHRDGDILSCGDVAGGSFISPPVNVFSDGGGNAGSITGEDPNQTLGYIIQSPLVEYGNDNNIAFNYVEGDPSLFTKTKACYHEYKPEFFHPMVEESTGAMFKNYPGGILSTKSGADLPSYAPDHFRDPIGISHIEVGGRIPPGISVDRRTGVVSGKLTEETIKNQSDPTNIDKVFNFFVTVYSALGADSGSFLKTVVKVSIRPVRVSSC